MCAESKYYVYLKKDGTLIFDSKIPEDTTGICVFERLGRVDLEHSSIVGASSREEAPLIMTLEDYSSRKTKIKYRDCSDGFVTDHDIIYPEVLKIEVHDRIVLTDATALHLFTGFSKCRNIEGFENFDFSNVSSFEYMFYMCYALQDFKGTISSHCKVSSIEYMFYKCYSLTSIDLSCLDLSDVKKSDYAFARCFSLTEVLAPTFNLVSGEESCAFIGSYRLSNVVSMEVSG